MRRGMSGRAVPEVQTAFRHATLHRSKLDRPQGLGMGPGVSAEESLSTPPCSCSLLPLAPLVITQSQSSDFKVRVSNPGIVVCLDLERPLETSKLKSVTQSSSLTSQKLYNRL